MDAGLGPRDDPLHLLFVHIARLIHHDASSGELLEELVAPLLRQAEHVAEVVEGA